MKKWFRASDGMTKGLLAAGILFSVTAAFLYSNFDGETITKWGFLLLESIRTGQFRSFPRLVVDVTGNATNYSMLLNFLVGFWLSPVYLLTHLLGIAAESLLVYELWYKVLLLGILAADLAAFGRLLNRLGWEDAKSAFAAALFLNSTVLCLAVLGKGQVDLLVLYFFLRGFERYVKEDWQAWAWFGAAFLCKPLILFVLMPLFLLRFHKDGLRVFVHAVLLFLPWAADYVLTALLMPEYHALSALVMQNMKAYFGGMSFTERMFYGGTPGISPFFLSLTAVAFYAFWLSATQKARIQHILSLPVLSLCCVYLFAGGSLQWLIYLMPLLLIGGLTLREQESSLLLLLGANVSLAAYFLVGETLVILPDTFYPVSENRVLAHALGLYGVETLSASLLVLSKTLLFGCILLLAAVILLQKDAKETGAAQDGTQSFWHRLWIGLVPVPMVLWILYSLLSWINF